MVIPFVQRLGHDPGFFEQILFDFGALDHAVVIEMYVDVLPEPRRIIVPYRFGVTESYKKENNRYKTALEICALFLFFLVPPANDRN